MSVKYAPILVVFRFGSKLGLEWWIILIILFLLLYRLYGYLKCMNENKYTQRNCQQLFLFTLQTKFHNIFHLNGHFSEDHNLISHDMHLIIDFILEWRVVRFNFNFEWRVFKQTFMADLFYSQNFWSDDWEEEVAEEIFFFAFYSRCLNWSLSHRLTSNKPTYYPIAYSDFLSFFAKSQGI